MGNLLQTHQQQDLETRQLLAPQREAQSTEDAAYGGGRYLGWLAAGFAFVGLLRNPRKAMPWFAVAVIGNHLCLRDLLDCWGGRGS